MKKVYPFVKVFAAFLLLIGFCSFISPIKQIYRGPLFFQKFFEIAATPKQMIQATVTVFDALEQAPVIRVLHYHDSLSAEVVDLEGEQDATPIKSLDELFTKAEPFEFMPKAVCQLRQLGVQAYGIEYPLTTPVVVGVCYRDLSREQITVIEHPAGANGLDFGLYYNKNRFSTGIYSGVNFQKWMSFGDELTPGISVMHNRGPYAGMEMSVRF